MALTPDQQKIADLEGQKLILQIKQQNEHAANGRTVIGGLLGALVGGMVFGPVGLIVGALGAGLGLRELGRHYS